MITTDAAATAADARDAARLEREAREREARELRPDLFALLAATTEGAILRRARRWADQGSTPARRALDFIDEVEHLATAAERTRWRIISEACGTDHLGAPLCSFEDVASWASRAADMGCRLQRLDAKTLSSLVTLELVPNVRFRAAYELAVEQGRAQANNFAAAIGCVERLNTSGGLVGDRRWAWRLLGVIAQEDGVGQPTVRAFIPYDKAVAICRALRLSFFDYGV